RWQAQTTGPVTFRVRGSAPSPDLDVGVGPTLALVTWLDANRVEEDPNTYAATWNATTGTVYRIEVESDGMGPFVLSWGPATSPPPTASVTDSQRRSYASAQRPATSPTSPSASKEGHPAARCRSRGRRRRVHRQMTCTQMRRRSPAPPVRSRRPTPARRVSS